MRKLSVAETIVPWVSSIYQQNVNALSVFLGLFIRFSRRSRFVCLEAFVLSLDILM